MRFFWPVYISVAAAATAGMYVAAPLARPYVPDFLQPAAPAVTAQSASPRLPGVLLLKSRPASRARQQGNVELLEGRGPSSPQATQRPTLQPAAPHSPAAPSVSP